MIFLMFFFLLQVIFNLIILTIISYKSSHPSKFSFLRKLGFHLTLYLMSQMITGIILGMYYIPNNLEFFEFIKYIISNVNNDLFTKYIYLNIAFVFFFSIYLLTVIAFTHFLEVKIINRFIINTRYKTFNFLLIMHENPLLLSISTLIGVYVYRVYPMEYPFNINLFNLIENLKNISTEFDFNLYSNIGGELPSGSSANNPFISGTNTPSDVNMESPRANNPESPSADNPETSNASNASNSSSSFAFSEHSPTISDADDDRAVRLMRVCRCCGLPSEEHHRSSCPCGEYPGTSWKLHNPFRDVHAQEKWCCTCGHQRGQYSCHNCGCAFCSRSCSSHQVSSILHFDPNSPASKSPSPPSDTEKPTAVKESKILPLLKRARDDGGNAELPQKRVKGN